MDAFYSDTARKHGYKNGQPLEQSSHKQESKLKKVLGFPALLLITINSIMGTGIFFLPALGAQKAGPASIISWLVLSAISVYIAACFGELASMFNKAGGIYEYSKQAFGHFWSFIIGWITLIAGNITIAMLIVGAIQYLNPYRLEFFVLSFAGLSIPVTLNLLICLAFIVIFNYIAYRGMQTSSFMLVTFSIITLGTLLLLIVPNFISFNPSNLLPFFPYKLSMAFVAIFFIAETFFGWETTTFLAEETKDSRTVMPKALVIGTITIAVICLLFVVSSLGAMSFKVFGLSKTPLTDLGMLHYGSLGKPLFTVLVYLSIIGSVAGWVVSAPRLILAMAEDKLFISSLAKVHKQYNSPYRAIVFQAIVSSLLIIIAGGSYKVLLELLVPLVLVMYSAVMLSLLALRKKMPDSEIKFKAPFGNTGVIVAIAFMLSLIAAWIVNMGHEAIKLLKLGLSFVFLGVPVFLLLNFYYNPDIIIKINNLFAYLSLLFERLLVPKKIDRSIFRHLGNIEGKTILEFGCGVGTLTKELAKKVGEKGFVYATDLSESSIRIAKKRIEKRGHKNVMLIHDKHQVNRVHYAVSRADSIISVGMLGYIQDIKKVLGEMGSLLSERGKIFFVDYVDIFKVLPNVGWLSDEEKLKELFRDAGFSVKVEKVKGLFWNYLFVYGLKTREDVPFV